MYQPTANGYFSGGGFLEIGAMQAGVKIIQSNDLDKDAIDSMNRNKQYFGHKIIHADIRDLTVLDQADADIHFYTYPCTKYTSLADIHGTRTGDDLFLHALRHTVLKMPDMYVVENVPGMKKFKVVMEVLTKLPGYYVHVFCPVDASNWLPQSRKRLIVIATRRESFIQPPSFARRIRLKDILEHNPEIELPQCAINRLNGKYRDKPIIVDPDQPGAIAPTCLAHYGKDLGTRLVKDKNSKHGVRPFTIREYARLQGVPDDYVFENKMSSYRLIGNGVAVPLGRWIGEQAMKYFN